MLGYVALAAVFCLLLAMVVGTMILCAVCFSEGSRAERGGKEAEAGDVAGVLEHRTTTQ
jgi:hypothetical protein